MLRSTPPSEDARACLCASMHSSETLGMKRDAGVWGFFLLLSLGVAHSFTRHSRTHSLTHMHTLDTHDTKQPSSLQARFERRDDSPSRLYRLGSQQQFCSTPSRPGNTACWCTPHRVVSGIALVLGRVRVRRGEMAARAVTHLGPHPHWGRIVERPSRSEHGGGSGHGRCTPEQPQPP